MVADKYMGFHNSTQTFSVVGRLEVVNGNVVLRGREGERDHIYPLHRAVRRYYDTVKMTNSMVKYGVRGWDTLFDIQKEFREKILEAIKQRYSMNIELEPEVAEFYQRFNPGDKQEKPDGADSKKEEQRAGDADAQNCPAQS